MAAALPLEPLDVDGRLDDEEHRAWEKALAEVPLSLDVGVDADVLKPLRETLARLSDLYRRTRDSLACPGSEEGRVLAQSLSEGAVNGAVSRLASGDWGPLASAHSGDGAFPGGEARSVRHKWVKQRCLGVAIVTRGQRMSLKSRIASWSTAAA